MGRPKRQVDEDAASTLRSKNTRFASLKKCIVLNILLCLIQNISVLARLLAALISSTASEGFTPTGELLNVNKKILNPLRMQM